MAMADRGENWCRRTYLKRKLEVEDDSSSDSDVAETRTEYLFGLVSRGRLNKLKEEKAEVYFLTKNREGDTFLHVAVKQWKTSGKSNLEMIKYLISREPQLMSEKDEQGRTALCYVCSICTDAQCFDIIEALVELYSTSSEALNIADRSGLTPLSQLVISASNFQVRNEKYNKMSVKARSDLLDKYCSTIELLISKGSDINVTDKNGKDLIMLTLDQNGFKEWLPNIVNVLIKNGLKSSIKALKYALIKKSIITHILIDNLDVNARYKNGNGIFYQLFTINNEFRPTIQLIKILIEKGADPSKEKIHIVQLARNCESNFEMIEYLLNTFPGYDINTKNKNGDTLLLQYGHNVKNLEKLIQLNADITAVDNSRNNIIHKMMDKKIIITSKLFKKLLDLGLNPFECNKNKMNGLLYICKCCYLSEINVLHSKWFPLLKEILKKSTYYIENSNSSMKSIQIGLLRYLYNCYSEDIVRDLTIYSILTKIVKYTNILSTLIVDLPVKKLSLNLFRCNESIKFQNLALDPITYMLSIKKYSSNLIEFIYNMLDLGVKLSNNSVNSITMILLKHYDVVRIPTTQNKSIISTLLANGHSIENSVLKLDKLSSTPKVVVQDMQEIKEKFVISDYLLITYMRDKWDLFVKYIQNCWFPPIFFVYFYIESVKYIVKKWIDALLPYGNIPCGSPLYEASRTLLQAAINRNEVALENNHEEYDQLMIPQDSPASLRELSKYAVRFMLAKKAIAQGSSLPKLIEEDIPPTLQFLVKVGHTETSSEETDDEVVYRHI